MRITLTFIAFICVSWSNLAEGCGRISVGETKDGGHESKRLLWPWIVSIDRLSPIEGEDGAGHMCAGILIDSEWVIAAARCLDMPDQPNEFAKKIPDDWRVTAGVYNRTKEEEKEGNWQTSTVLRFIYHEEFHDYTTHSVHDIALVQLTKPFTRTDYVRPICIPLSRPALRPGFRSKCYVAGWGKTGEDSTTPSQTLRHVPLLLINQNYCDKAFTPLDFYNKSQHICGGNWYTGNKEACMGDSGGPLACQSNNGFWFIEGIASSTTGCGNPQRPSVYTKIRAYKKWIVDTARAFTIITSRSGNAATSSKGQRARRSSGYTYIHGSAIDSLRHLIASERESL